MVSQVRALEILQNDAAMLDVSTRREARPGMWIMTFPGELMPSSHPVEYTCNGQLNHKELLKFIKEVRQEYARQSGNQAETLDESPARDVSSEGADPEPDVTGGVDIPEAAALPDVEDTLEDVIKSQVSRLRSAILTIESRITELGAQREQLRTEFYKASQALGVYLDDEEVLPAKAAPRRKRKRTKKPAPSKGQAVKSDGGEVGDSAENS